MRPAFALPSHTPSHSLRTGCSHSPPIPPCESAKCALLAWVRVVHIRSPFAAWRQEGSLPLTAKPPSGRQHGEARAAAIQRLAVTLKGNARPLRKTPAQIEAAFVTARTRFEARSNEGRSAKKKLDKR